jgi:hypothetical protein
MRRAEIGRVNIQAAIERRRQGELRLSPEMEKAIEEAAAAKKVIERLTQKQDAAVREMLGMSRHDVFIAVWREPLPKAAKRIGVATKMLKRICDLYEIPYPRHKSYWSMRPESRPVRVSPL